MTRSSDNQKKSKNPIIRSSGYPIIGVLALQGAVQPHKPHIEAAGGEFRAVKTPEQFDEVDAFILPGGESTTMLKLIETFGLWDSLRKNFEKKPVWGICAGSILLAEKVIDPAQKSFGILPITVQRNAYGRQIDSHHAEIDGYPISLIRAPVITDAGKTEVLAEHEDTPVWVRLGRNMATTFHPELTLDYPSPMHKAFIDLVRKTA
jgi:pyridoxal 5'-phosphate synthase pdxT subunit